MAKKEEAAGLDPPPPVDERLSFLQERQADAATIVVADPAVVYRRLRRGSAEDDSMRRCDQRSSARRANNTRSCTRCACGGASVYDEGVMAKTTPSTQAIEIVEPIGNRVLIRKDADKKVTKVGIHLPDKIEIPTLTGRIVAVSAQVDNDEDYPIKQYDRVLFNPKNGIPVDFEGDNRLFVVPIKDVVAVFRKE
jgi:chaperonin GroES